MNDTIRIDGEAKIAFLLEGHRIDMTVADFCNELIIPKGREAIREIVRDVVEGIVREEIKHAKRRSETSNYFRALDGEPNPVKIASADEHPTQSAFQFDRPNAKPKRNAEEKAMLATPAAFKDFAQPFKTSRTKAAVVAHVLLEKGPMKRAALFAEISRYAIFSGVQAAQTAYDYAKTLSAFGIVANLSRTKRGIWAIIPNAGIETDADIFAAINLISDDEWSRTYIVRHAGIARKSAIPA